MVRSPSNASLHVHSLTAGARQGSLKFTSQEAEQVAQINSTNEDPFQLCVRAEVTRMLLAAVDSLVEKERQILAQYYLEEKTMKEVGRALNLHESGISQTIGVALDHLRACLRKAKPLPDPGSQCRSWTPDTVDSCLTQFRSCEAAGCPRTLAYRSAFFIRLVVFCNCFFNASTCLPMASSSFLATTPALAT